MNSAKYHLNPATGEINICKAQKRPCQYGGVNHFDSKYKAERHFENIMNKKIGAPKRNLPPIIVPLNLMCLPNTWSINNIRDSIKVNDYGDVVGVELIQAIEEYTGCSESKWNDSFKKCITDNYEAWDSPDSWSGADDFLSDVIITPPNDFDNKLLDAYYNSNNADDSLGVLSHVREKGFDTSGLKPVEAIKKMLREENGRYVTIVENMHNVDKRKLGLNEFSYSELHFAKIDETEPRAISTNSIITGIVRLDDFGYHLLDGHHRVKWCLNNNMKNGNFFVLS